MTEPREFTRSSNPAVTGLLRGARQPWPTILTRPCEKGERLMDRYVVISADCHAGADLRITARFSSRVPRRVRRLGRQLRQPLRRPGARRRRPQLGQQQAHARAGSRRGRGRGHLPEHGPAVLPAGRSRRPRTEGRRVPATGWPDCGRTTGGSPSSAPQYPHRRAGVGQILLNDVDEAVRDVHWIADNGLRGGALLPGTPPGSGVDPLHSPVYDPVWRACEERGVS